MIMTRTPLRVSFAGGGTDLPGFYEKQYGAVLSSAINKYLYVTVKRHGKLFRENYRLNYSESENAQNLDEVKNAIARECLRFLKVEPPIYISTVADLPSSSGLGSSSSFAVGLLNALHALKGERPSAGHLAEEAAAIEIEVLKHPIGKQDHYAAAFGGVNYICFLPDGGVSLEPQKISLSEINEIFNSLLMFWTGINRSSNSVLLEQKKNTKKKADELLTMRDQAKRMRDLIQNGFNLEVFGRLLNEGWHLKRELAKGITNDRIDTWYTRAMESGAFGGKLCGAGGGGFLLFIVNPRQKEAVRKALPDLHEVPIGYEAQGSSILMSFI